MKHPARAWNSIALTPAAIILACTAGVPALYAVVGSLLSTSPSGTVFTGLRNLVDVARDPGIGSSLRITTLWAMITTAIAFGSGFLLGITLHESRLRNVLYPSLVLPWGIPAFILVPLWRMLLHGEGGTSIITLLTGFSIDLLNDTISGFFSTAFVAAWSVTPVIAFAIYATLENMPSMYRDAAVVEGAGTGSFAFRVFAPMHRTLLVTLAVLTFFKGIKEFTVIHILTDGGPPFTAGILGDAIVGITTTIEVYLYRLFETTFDFGTLSAYALVPFVLVIPAILLWLHARNSSVGGRSAFTRPVGLIVLLVVLQPVLYGLRGIPSALVYLGIGLFPAFSVPLFCADVGYNLFNLLQRGFPSGLNPAFIIACCAAPMFVTMWRRTGPTRQTRKTSKARRSANHAKTGAPITPHVFSTVRGAVAVISIGIACILCYLLIWLSLSKTDLIFIDRLTPEYATTENFIELFSGGIFVRSLYNSFRLSVCTAVLTVLVTFPAAVVIGGMSRSASGRFLAAIQASVAIGGMHTLIPLYWMARRLGLVGNYLPVVVLYTAHAIPISALLLTAFVRKIPQSFRDVAHTEGCSKTGYALRILIPLVRPTLILVAIVAFVGAWNGFLAPLVFLFDADRYPVSLVLYHLVGTIGSSSPRWGLFAAGSLINLVLLSGLLVYLRKHLQNAGLADYSSDA